MWDIIEEALWSAGLGTAPQVVTCSLRMYSGLIFKFVVPKWYMHVIINTERSWFVYETPTSYILIVIVYITFFKPPKMPYLLSASNLDQAKYILQKHLKYKYSSATKYQVCLITIYHLACFQVIGGGEGGGKGWDGWIASLTQWTWVWTNSGRWWRTGKPGMLQSMESQRAGHDSVTEQRQQQSDWTKSCFCFVFLQPPHR